MEEKRNEIGKAFVQNTQAILKNWNRHEVYGNKMTNFEGKQNKKFANLINKFEWHNFSYKDK